MSDDKNLKKDELFSDEEILDHDYDGIKELNNGMPFWLTWLFVGSIMFGIIYYIHYTSESAETIAQSYENSLAEHTAKMESKRAAVSVEDMINELNTPEAIAEGNQVYTTRCAACHGQAGEGGIGPNLVDKYWIHGDGSLSEVVKVVENGVTEKGMPAWGQVMGMRDVITVSYYIESIKGSNPPNQKEAQGNLIE